MSDAEAGAGERLIVALDVPSGDAALQLVDRLGSSVKWYKIGLELYIAAGSSLVHAVAERGKKIFLDLKLHDIPETVGRACEVIAALPVDLVTVHCSGGVEMMKRAQQGLSKSKRGARILGVTVLTSLDEHDLVSDGYERRLEELVVTRALNAKFAGVGGIIASPKELPLLRSAVPSPFLIITPGIRPAAVGDDQKRTASAKEARAQGADAIVVGRPIRDAAHPQAVVKTLLADLT